MLNKYKYLLLILTLGAILRFAFINKMPPSLNWDEVSHGYNAYSILKTGKDEWGVTLPTIFRAFGDYKLPVYIYLTVPSIALFGLNAVGVRFPSALGGVITILFTYLLAKKLFKDNRSKETISLVAGLLMAVEPWNLFVSRAAIEANLSLTFIVGGVYFFFKGLEKKYYFLFASILLGLSVWTYNSARISVPILLVGLLFIYKDKIRSTLYLFISLIFFVPMFIQLINPAGQARYGAIQILDEGATASIDNSRNSSNLPSILPKLIYNKITYFGIVFAKQYIEHFSLNFLFLKGGTDYQFNVPNWGVLYIIDLPFILIGLYVLFKNLNNKNYQFIFLWIIVSPIASSITRDSPHVLRSIVMLPTPMFLTALGLVNFSKKYRPIIITVFVSLALIFMGDYLNIYATSYRTNYSWSWQYGYEQIVNYAKSNYDKYDQIIITKAYGEPHEFFLFFINYDPNKYRSDPNLIRFYQSNWYWVDHFDKFWFVNDWQVKDLITESKHKIDCRNKKCLLITTPNNYPAGFTKLEEIKFLDGKTAFELYTN